MDPSVVGNSAANPVSNSLLEDLTPDFLAVLLEIFANEIQEEITRLAVQLPRIHTNPQDREALQIVRRSFHTIKGSGRMVGANYIGEFAWALERLLNSALTGELTVSPALIAVVDEARLALPQLITLLDHGNNPLPTEIDNIAHQANNFVRSEATPVATADNNPAMDREWVNLFVMEGEGLLEQFAELLAKCIDQKDSIPAIHQLRRLLHTLKGSARMADLLPIAELSHSLESLLQRIVEQPTVVDGVILRLLQQSYDELFILLDQARNGAVLVNATELLWQIEKHLTQLTGTTSPAMIPATPERVITEVPEEEQLQRATGKVWVAGQLLTQLSEQASEVNTLRSRLDQQVTQTRSHIQQMGLAIGQLQEQLRCLEGEEGDNFTCALKTLANLQGSLVGENREIEGLLVQQAHLTRELQEGLLRTRLVPFGELVPRLQRVVRQTAKSLAIQAQLHIQGGEIELERTVLDRLLAPLEHILRNAIAHGIESPEQRGMLGKTIPGIINLQVKKVRQEAVITITDDGRGLDIAGIRKKAQEQGLIEAATVLADKDIMLFILEAGVSTAEQISHIAGRGIGLNIVHNTVKQLGGALYLDSVLGQGSCFTIRLPLATAVNKVLLVVIQQELYAIPLAAISEVLQLQAEQANCLYRDITPILSRNGVDYRFIHGAALVDAGTPSLLTAGEKLPVLLFNHEGLVTALAIDGILGVQEITPKPIGPQFNQVRGISGATLLGNGQIAIVLDITALLEKGPPLSVLEITQSPLSLAYPYRVLIVDDSITVRRVTGDFLQRHGMTVIMAANGPEALQLLGEHLVDIILMDIEMPDMDGYQLAHAIRHQLSLVEIPIIAISSYRSISHQKRATQVGINYCLNKPYPEEALLQAIYGLIVHANS